MEGADRVPPMDAGLLVLRPENAVLRLRTGRIEAQVRTAAEFWNPHRCPSLRCLPLHDGAHPPAAAIPDRGSG